MTSSVVQRSVTSFSWNLVAQVIAIGVGFVRSILLARLLQIDTFGIYAGALAVVGLASILPTLGLSGAFVHRAPETRDEEHAAAVFLSLQLLATGLWLALMVGMVLLFSSGPTRTALLVISATTALEQTALVHNALHVRRVAHRRLALVGTIGVLATAVVTVGMAWWGFELWALLAGEIAVAVAFAFGLMAFRPIWRPRLAWDAAIVRYYLRFGLPNMAATLIENALQRVDDLFVRYRLGVTEMGFYSRAYTFASYPRSVLSAPVALVAGGAFAELAHNREQLSKAFFRTAALLARAGFLLAGWLVLIAPEFVILLLGEKWLPMVPIFRLLSIFALLDPLRDVLSQLFIAVGQPARLALFRLIQLGVLVVGLAVLGTAWGTVGVALAVDLMLLTGIALLIWAVRPWVDFSSLRLFGLPALALLLALAATQGALLWLAPGNLWLSATLKSLLFVGIYGGVLLAGEGRELAQMVQAVRSQLRRAPATPKAASE